MATVKTVQSTLQLTFGIVPIVAGLDKFTNLLANWTDYLGKAKDIMPIDSATLMEGVGVIEVIAGALVFVRPRIGAFIVMAWLIVVALQLIIYTNFYDVAVRDLVMAVAAYTLAQLTIIKSGKNY